MNKNYLYNVGEIVNELEILEQIRVKHKDETCTTGYSNIRGYIVKCNIHNYGYSTSEYDLKRGSKCQICSNRKCVEGINDVATTHPELMKYFVYKNDSSTHTYGSGKEILMKCPYCGYKKLMKINTLTSQEFGCQMCGDGISYPEKYVANFLVQIRTKFKTQLSKKTFNWCNNIRYDFYLPDFNCIIETHGIQHYQQTRRNGARSLEEENNNDINKKKLAKANRIANYIELDCRESTGDYIKESILSSKLYSLLNLEHNKINWLECEKATSTSLMREVIGLWNDKCENEFVNDIKNKIKCNISNTTIIKYLHKGKEIGLCDYDGIYEIKRSNIIKNSGEKDHMYGKHHSEETKKKLSEAHKGKSIPEKTRKKMSKSHKGKNSMFSKPVICNNLYFYSVSACSECYKKELKHYLNGRCKMPQQYIDLGLRYATEEDLEKYPTYEPDKEIA